MGVGRRMKKQGAPEPLSEAHFAKLARKSGRTTESDAGDGADKQQKKKRKFESKPATNGKAAKTNGNTAGGKPVKRLKVSKSEEAPPSKSKPAKATAAAAKPLKASKKTKPVVPLTNDDDDDDDDDDEMLGDDDDEFNMSDLEGVPMKDDFLESDNESVVDSDVELENRGMFSEDEDDSDAEERLTAANIEGLSKKLDQQMADDEAEAQAELEEAALQTNIHGDAPKILEDEDDELEAQKTLLAPDLQVLRSRITENIRVLDDFSKLAVKGRSRAEYMAQFTKDICSYYGYSEFLAEKLINLFTPREAFAFFEANEAARPVVIRTNTLRTHRRDLAQALINRGVTLEPVGKWSKVGLQIFESTVPLGATPEYLAGHYILQAASSFLPCIALDPKENERVLDMAAAPGGKTTYLAAMMKNTGFIMANDPSRARAKALIGNVHRLGARNVVVSNYDAREFPKPMGGFDRVLLDAPCSGTGVIAKDPSVKTNRNETDFLRLPHMQKQLLLAAIDSVNHHSASGGFIVYSTCSVAVEENEQVVQYALKRRPNVRLVESGLPFGKEGFVNYMGKQFDPTMRMSRRYYPHTYNVDGFFVAKLQKFGPTPENAVGGMADAPAAGKKSGAKGSSGAKGTVRADDEMVAVDRTPIVDDDDEAAAANDDFGGFDDDEDAAYILKAKKNAMRRRGLDPHALDKNKHKKAPQEKKK